MFNFILHNIVLSVPVVNSTKFIVLLFSFESFLFLKKAEIFKFFLNQNDFKCYQYPLLLIYRMLCYALPMPLPCYECSILWTPPECSLSRLLRCLGVYLPNQTVLPLSFLNILQTPSSAYLLVLFSVLAVPIVFNAAKLPPLS